MGRNHNLSLNVEFLTKRKKEIVERCFKQEQKESVVCLSVSALREIEHSWTNLFTQTFTSKNLLIDFIINR